jgi:transposase
MWFGILAYFVGILVHGHLTSYYNFDFLTLAECNQHILRALKGLSAVFSHAWIGEMSELLRGACHAKNELARAGASEMPPEAIKRFSDKYDEILQKGRLEYEAAAAKDGEDAYTEERRLLARLSEFKDEHLLFLNDFNAPFSNNVSEQAIRYYKGKGKAVGCFRSMEGAQIYARIASLIVTLRKQNRNVFEGMRAIFSGGVAISTA